jgi:hypothetical protein
MDEQYGKLIEPAPVPFSFGAPGWYVLGALCLLCVLLIVWLIWKHYVKNKYRTYALQWLNTKEQHYTSDKNYDALVYETVMLIKRIAMSRYGRENVAGKRDDEFISYINSTWKAKAFDEADKVLFSENIYSAENIEQQKATVFVSKAKQWIKKHV